MRHAAKGAALGFFRLRYVLRRTPGEFVSINCPARSGSTLLSNILCNHPQICGFGETNTTYRSSADLSELVAQVYWGNRRLAVRERYVLERIVLNRLLPNAEALNDAPISWIYLLRGPAAALRSNMEIHNRTEQRALNHYLYRLERLRQDACHFAEQGHRAFFLTYEQLIADPQSVLNALGCFLDLTGDLRPAYKRPRVHDMRAGDQSERIKAGQIVAAPRHYSVELSANALEQARAAQAECEAILRRCCESVNEQHSREAALRDAPVQ